VPKKKSSDLHLKKNKFKLTQHTGKLVQCKTKKGNGKFGPLYITKACRGVRCILSVISNVGSTSRLVNFI